MDKITKFEKDCKALSLAWAKAFNDLNNKINYILTESKFIDFVKAFNASHGNQQ